MGEQLLILIGTGLVSNLILDHMLGVDPLLAVTRRPGPALDLALLMLILLPVTTAGAWLLDTLLLQSAGLAHLRLTALVLLISMLVMLLVRLLARLRPHLYTRFELYIPLVMANCAILGVALLNTGLQHGLISSAFAGLGFGAGFGLVLLMLAAIRERIAAAAVPLPFRGTAILLITLGLMSMAFMGFNGIGNYR